MTGGYTWHGFGNCWSASWHTFTFSAIFTFPKHVINQMRAYHCSWLSQGKKDACDTRIKFANINIHNVYILFWDSSRIYFLWIFAVFSFEWVRLYLFLCRHRPISPTSRKDVFTLIVENPTAHIHKIYTQYRHTGSKQILIYLLWLDHSRRM